jgi:AcrR family transcriptional regulator
VGSGEAEEQAQAGGRRPDRAEQLRAAIAHAALAAFAELGWGGAGVAELAQRAAVTKNQLFYYFPSKEAIALAALEQAAAALLAALPSSAAGGTALSQTAALREGLLAELGRGAPRLRFLAALSAARGALPEEFGRQLDALLNELLARLRRLSKLLAAELEQSGRLSSHHVYLDGQSVTGRPPDPGAQLRLKPLKARGRAQAALSLLLGAACVEGQLDDPESLLDAAIRLLLPL